MENQLCEHWGLEYQRSGYLEPAWLPKRDTVLCAFGAWARMSYFVPSKWTDEWKALLWLQTSSRSCPGPLNVLNLNPSPSLADSISGMLLDAFLCFLSLPHCPTPGSEHRSSEHLQWIIPWGDPCSPCIPTVQPVRSCENAYLTMFLSFLKPFKWLPILSKTKLNQEGPAWCDYSLLL